MLVQPLARLALLAALVLSFLAPLITAQTVTEKHPELGLPGFARPRIFEPIPTDPNEQWVKLQYSEKLKKGVEGFRSKLYVVIIPRGDEEEADPNARSKGSKDKPGPIVNFRSYFGNLYPGWKLGESEKGKRMKGAATLEYRMEGTDKNWRNHRGYAYTFEEETRTVALLGIAHKDKIDDHAKLWRKCALKVKLGVPVESKWGDKKLERLYSGGKYSHPDYRINVRKAMVDPWQAEDIENFIIIYNTKDQPLLRKVARDLELLRLEYMKLFPPQAKFDAVSTVRICKNRDEYIEYGGAPSSAGYWNSRAEELVLYDAQVKEKGKRSDDSDTFIVLYHEAFHQYIHYSTGELPPHSWFNEGYGDFFSGAEIKNGKVRKIGINPWRAGNIQYVLEQGNQADWKDITAWSQAEYYANGAANYAQGWSMVFFLNTSKKVKKHATWSHILPTYFNTLKTTYADELKSAGNPRDGMKRERAGAKAREKALERAFEGVEFHEIQREWEDFVRKLEVPERD